MDKNGCIAALFAIEEELNKWYVHSYRIMVNLYSEIKCIC
jgi:hypothetical protein